jgi:hypothetical protein
MTHIKVLLIKKFHLDIFVRPVGCGMLWSKLRVLAHHVGLKFINVSVCFKKMLSHSTVNLIDLHFFVLWKP